MKKKYFLGIGIILAGIAMGCCLWASQHPEMQFPWGQKVTYIFYGVYIWLMFECLIDMPFLYDKRDDRSLRRDITYFCMAAIWLVWTITDEVNWLTVARGLIVAGNCDLGISNLRGWIKKRNTDIVKA